MALAACAEKTTLPRALAGVSESFYVAMLGARVQTFTLPIEEYGPQSPSAVDASSTYE
jgi:hypothetical protein